MSDSHALRGISRKRPRQPLTASRKARRGLRIAGLATVAGAVAMIAVPAAANAAVVTTPNPTCAIPAGATYQESYAHVGIAPRFEGFWEAYSAGVWYNAAVINFSGPPLQALAAGYPVSCSTSSSPVY
jgi:hypothetical protein